MKNSDSLSRFVSGSGKSSGQNISRLLASTNIVSGANSEASSNSGRTLSPGSQRDLKSLSLLAKKSLTGIQFGTHPSSGTSSAGSSSSGSGWASLLGQTTSGGGLLGLFSAGLGDIGGIGSIVSGIAGLFGSGKKTTLPELTPFQLPDSQEQTLYIRSQGTAAYQGNSAQQAVVAQPGTGIYGSSGQAQSTPSNTDAQWFLDNSVHIAQAVKKAMLNSNSLNDVVSEV